MSYQGVSETNDKTNSYAMIAGMLMTIAGIICLIIPINDQEVVYILQIIACLFIPIGLLITIAACMSEKKMAELDKQEALKNVAEHPSSVAGHPSSV